VDHGYGQRGIMAVRGTAIGIGIGIAVAFEWAIFGMEELRILRFLIATAIPIPTAIRNVRAFHGGTAGGSGFMRQ
jgi:hypothetical protein